jgi:hypothetical protein
MMLFDPVVGLSIKGGSVARRQGGIKEIMRVNECKNETEKNRFEKCHVAPGVRPEVKMANEIVCNHVWDKLYSPDL